MKIDFSNVLLDPQWENILTVDDVTMLLKKMGFKNVSKWVVRRYSSNGIIANPINRSPIGKTSNTRYRSYYKPEVVFEISDIRGKLNRGTSISTLIWNGELRRRYELDIQMLEEKLIEKIKEYLTTDESKYRKRAKNKDLKTSLREELVVLVEIIEHDKELMKECIFGLNPKNEHKKILEKYLATNIKQE